MKEYTEHQIANGKTGGRLPHFDGKWLTNGHFFISVEEDVAKEILKESHANFPMPSEWSEMCDGWISVETGEDLTQNPTESEDVVTLGDGAFLAGYVVFFEERGYKFSKMEPIAGNHGVKIINKSGEAVGILLGCYS